MINIIKDDNEIHRVVNILNDSFRDATANAGKPSRLAAEGTASKQLYDWQVDYAYRLNDITKSPPYIVSKLVNNCFAFIETIKKERINSTN